MNKYKKLFNNSLLFALGNIGSKLINIIMVPLYTYKLSTDQYGTVDLMLTTINLLIPIFTLEIGSAVIRFTINSKSFEKKQNIINKSLMFLFIISVVIIIISPLLYYFNVFENFLFLFIFLLINMLFNNVLSQFIRGIEKIKAYAFNGILQTIITVAMNLLFLLVLNWNVIGYLLSLIIATLISNVYLLFQGKEYINYKYFNFKNINLITIMGKYSVPLIPNTIMWWIINGSTRFLILYFIDASANGLYAVANKIPTIISTFGTIFIQAWQISAFEEYDNNDRDEFNSMVFNSYSTVLFLVGSAILVILKPVMSIFVSDNFFESWRLVPFLVLAVIYQSLSGFLGINYTAAMNTRKSFSTSVYGGVVSLLTSILLIPLLGLIGASISSFISFFVMFIFRLLDTKKMMDFRIDKTRLILSNIIFLLQITILFISQNNAINIIILVSMFVLIVLLNIKIIKALLKILLFNSGGDS